MADDKFDDRWSDFRDLVAHMFLESGHPCADAEVAWYPATDAYQTEREFVVRMELSGVSPEDLRIRIQGETLQVKGLRRDPGTPDRKRFHKMEIAMGPFLRTLQVPGEFSRGQGRASYRDGILEIRLEGKRKHTSQEISIEPASGEGA